MTEFLLMVPIYFVCGMLGSFTYEAIRLKLFSSPAPSWDATVSETSVWTLDPSENSLEDFTVALLQAWDGRTLFEWNFSRTDKGIRFVLRSPPHPGDLRINKIGFETAQLLIRSNFVRVKNHDEKFAPLRARWNPNL